MRKKWFCAASCALTLFATSAFAVTYVVPTDHEMVRRSHAIVVATAVNSYTRLTTAGGVETITTFDVDEALMGLLAATRIDITEPGGVFGEHMQLIAGVPQFEPGDHVLLFLRRTPQQTWAITDLGLGKFSIVTDSLGRLLAVRDEGELVGWDTDGRPHREQQRSAQRFLEFLRTEVRGGAGSDDYFVSRAPLVIATTSASKLKAAPNAFTATSYTMPISGSLGSRWTTGSQSILSQNSEPGAAGNGTTAIQSGCNLWTGGGAHYSYGGNTGGAGGLASPDGKNTVLFERDLSGYGISAFSGCSGTLGIGGITNASGTHSFNGETFVTTLEGDVEMNQGIQNCPTLFSNGKFNAAVAHELGHTLGFRHSDQVRGGTAPCTSDPSLECSSSAIMTASLSVTGGLTGWDTNAVRATYVPGGTGTCTAPSIQTQPQSQTINSGDQATLSVVAAGTAPFTYLWYTGTPPSGPVAPGPNNTGATYNPSPTTTTTYWVRVTNSCGTVDSGVATVTVNQTSCTPPSIITQPQGSSILTGQQATLSVAAGGTGPLSYQWYIGSPPDTSTPIATGASINVSPSSTTSYWVRVTGQCAPPADSRPAVVQVTASCTPPTIINDPPDQQITSGTSTSLFVGYSGSTSTVTWYRGAAPDQSMPVGSGQSFITGPLTTMTQYWARVVNSCGQKDSRTVTVSVTTACVAPNITLADAGPKSITPGQTVTLTVQATGTSLQYQWYRGIAPDTSSPVAGANTATATDTPSASTSYWVRVSNSCGSKDSGSIAVTVGTVTCNAPAITTINADATVISDTAVTLTVTATGDPTLHYQWYRGAAGDTSNPVGSDSASFVSAALFDDAQFWVKVTNGCATSAQSRTVNITVIPARHRAARH